LIEIEPTGFWYSDASQRPMFIAWNDIEDVSAVRVDALVEVTCVLIKTQNRTKSVELDEMHIDFAKLMYALERRLGIDASWQEEIGALSLPAVKQLYASKRPRKEAKT
jgi:hypothetical protein